MATRQELDNEKLLKFLDHEYVVKDHGQEFKSRKSASVREIRDRFHWTLTRSQRAFDELLAAEKIMAHGFRIMDWSFKNNETIYCVTKVTVPA